MNNGVQKNDKKTVLVTGSGGQLGSELHFLSENKMDCKYVSRITECLNFIFVTRKELDVQSKTKIVDFFQKNKIDVIINCAAYTAVDKAESEPEQANAINHLGAKNLAQIAKEKNIGLVHISTDYVFDGTNYKPYKESDKTNPKSVYGKTKLDGELAIKTINPVKSIIIRTSWVYSEFGNNFVKTMLRLGKERDELNVVSDQVGSPTSARGLAKTILHIIPQLNNPVVETYHYSNLGVCSWYDFTQTIFEISNTDCHVNAIPSEAYPTPAQRPYYSVLDKTKIIAEFGLELDYWKKDLSMLNGIRT